MDIKTTFILYDSSSQVTWGRRAAAWLVHAFTGLGSVLGLLMLYEAYQHNFIMVFWLMAAASSALTLQMAPRGIELDEFGDPIE